MSVRTTDDCELPHSLTCEELIKKFLFIENFCLSYEFKIEISKATYHWLGADHPEMCELSRNLIYECLSQVTYTVCRQKSSNVRGGGGVNFTP